MRFLIIALSICGMIVSGLALRVHYSTDIQPCSINERWDCGVVNHSRFAEVGHIPVAAIGIAGYAALLLLSAFNRRSILVYASAAGCVYALYLTHVEADLLRVWCLYCVVSQAIIALIAVLALTHLWFAHNMKRVDRV